MPVSFRDVAVDANSTLDALGDAPVDMAADWPWDISPVADAIPDGSDDSSVDLTQLIDQAVPDAPADQAAPDAPADVGSDLKDGSGSDATDATFDAVMCNGVNCNDNIPCTLNLCLDSGCTNPVMAGNCLIAGQCHKDGQIKGPGSCQKCNAAGLSTSWTDDSSLCSDDGLTCTVTTCKGGACGHALQPGSCIISGVCYAAGTASPQNPCLGCNPLKATAAWSPLPPGAKCKDDGYACTIDTCSSKGSCQHAVVPGNCLISGKCHKEGTPTSSGACTGCVSSKATTTWSNFGSGTACKDDGYSCTSDKCNASGTCKHTVYSGQCLISGKCYNPCPS